MKWFVVEYRGWHTGVRTCLVEAEDTQGAIQRFVSSPCMEDEEITSVTAAGIELLTGLEAVFAEMMAANDALEAEENAADEEEDC